jgi:cell division protein FtsB
MRNHRQRVPRDLTDAERKRLLELRRRIEALEAEVDELAAERDRLIYELWDLHVKVTQLAEAIGLSRATVHTIIGRERN